MKEGKNEFYAKAKSALTSAGFGFYDGESDIPGKGSGHASKPDYIATKSNMIVIGEIKSPKEGPLSGSWRQIQHSDGEGFKAVRNDIARKERDDLIKKEVGGHLIIILGQIPDYVQKIGRNYDLPYPVSKRHSVMGGYTVPSEEYENVHKAFSCTNNRVREIINIGNGSVTFIFSF